MVISVLVPPGLDIPVSDTFGAVSIVTLGEYVTQQADEVLLIVVKDEAQASLAEIDKVALRSLGCRIDELGQGCTVSPKRGTSAV